LARKSFTLAEGKKTEREINLRQGAASGKEKWKFGKK